MVAEAGEHRVPSACRGWGSWRRSPSAGRPPPAPRSGVPGVAAPGRRRAALLMKARAQLDAAGEQIGGVLIAAEPRAHLGQHPHRRDVGRFGLQAARAGPLRQRPSSPPAAPGRRARQHRRVAHTRLVHGAEVGAARRRPRRRAPASRSAVSRHAGASRGSAAVRRRRAWRRPRQGSPAAHCAPRQQARIAAPAVAGIAAR